ncbi:MAG: DNA mismatch endonuclease Vsr [Chloroflexi bacterium]|nr:DNA mismatch endonuclease Vsr [Chloroflexota bacterium]RIK20102.1 MAG: very short patch repair endonuclease [Chloroflexota bacterium]
MRRVKRNNTGPEKAVRRILWALGYRFVTHSKSLPGTPDIVFTRKRKVVFVHGCFWHAHAGCPRATIPKTHSLFWQSKLDRNRERDIRVSDALRAGGWDVFVVWECELQDSSDLERRLADFLGPTRTP